jgi:hypothetical protein
MKAFKALLILIFFSTTSYAEEAPELTNIPVSNVLEQSPIKTDEKFSLELFSFEDFLYTGSRKIELGDQARLTSRFRYQITDNAWTSLGFRTDPDQDRFDNKTSDFELRAGYLYKNLVAQADFSFNTNDPDGGISFGFDLDSENTFLRYRIKDNLQLTFFPFNFDGEVGVDFDTGDITRIYFIQGNPTNIPIDTTNATDPTRVAQKTMPGFVLRYNNVTDQMNSESMYVGIAAATYEYPNDPNFNVVDDSTAGLWSRKAAVGYKAGVLLRRPNTFTSLQYIGQTQDEETGALIRSAASLYSLTRVFGLMTEFELTATEGGRRPWRVSRDGESFGDTDLAVVNINSNRVFADRAGNLQNWTGDWGLGASLKVGTTGRDFRPYFSYRYLTEDFVYSSRISAHNLRTNDLSESHGGLHGIGLGAFLYTGNFIVNPRFEYLSSSNDVFGDPNDLRETEFDRNLKNSDFSFFVNVSYFFNRRTGPRTFRL